MERKTLLLSKAAVTDDGEFSGYANVFNVVDRGGDRVLPGAFAKDLPRFLAEGFIAWGHNWSEMVAMPTAAKEDGTGLFIGGRFHSTDRAQEARTITKERLDAGLSMGLSIGYDTVDYEHVSEDGARIRNLKELVVYETSLVAVPMNQLSAVTAVKGAGLGSGLAYADHLDWVTTEVEAMVRRSRERAEARSKEGRVLSSANRDRLARLGQVMREALADLDVLMTETEPEKERIAREWAALRAEAMRLGVPVTR